MMKNPFVHSLDNKRYYTWNYFLKTTFNSKVYKVPLSLATTCPNRDGSKGIGGCSFCFSGGGGTEYSEDNLREQFREASKPLEKKWPNSLSMPYFQSFSNTYVDVAVLKKALEEAMMLPKAVGICIATRPDCLPDDIVELLAEISKKTFLMVELGLQTIHQSTANIINRGHTFEEFLEGYSKLTTHNIPVCIHLINGLPHETKDMMLASVNAVSDLEPHSVKLHMLHVLRGTRLAEEYCAKPFEMLTKEEYVQIVCDQIELLPPQTVLQRVTGDPPKELLLTPLWTLDKLWVRNAIDKELVRRESWQGKALI